ncbi:MAG TPA: helix-turn-helix transcriptional regulator [Candidatus Xenobia bacterium]
MPDSEALGHKIAELRRKRKWTQTELAQKLGVHMQNVTRWETNRIRPSEATLVKMSEVFGVNMDELLDGKLELPPALSQDRHLAERIEMLKELDTDERAIIYNIIETYVTQKRLARLLNMQKTSVSSAV